MGYSWPSDKMVFESLKLTIVIIFTTLLRSHTVLSTLPALYVPQKRGQELLHPPSPEPSGCKEEPAPTPTPEPQPATTSCPHPGHRCRQHGKGESTGTLMQQRAIELSCSPQVHGHNPAPRLHWHGGSPGVRLPGFKSQLYLSLAVCPQANPIVSPCLNVHIYKMEFFTVFPS